MREQTFLTYLFRQVDAALPTTGQGQPCFIFEDGEPLGLLSTWLEKIMTYLKAQKQGEGPSKRMFLITTLFLNAIKAMREIPSVGMPLPSGITRRKRQEVFTYLDCLRMRDEVLYNFKVRLLTLGTTVE